jgi:hypothetical protein
VERTGDRLHWVIIRVPLDVHKIWGVRGQLKIKGEIRPAGSKAAGFAGAGGLCLPHLALSHRLGRPLYIARYLARTATMIIS